MRPSARRAWSLSSAKFLGQKIAALESVRAAPKCGSGGVARSARSRRRRRWFGPPGGLFFKLGPAVLLPALDGFFVTLQRATGRALATPAQLSQQAPDVRRMVAHPAQLLDQPGDPWRRPQCRLVAQCLRSAFERLLDCLQVCRAQLGLASGAPGLFQPGAARLPQLADPANQRLPMNPQTPRYFGLAHALLQQLGRRHPAPLQALKVPLHPCRITHPAKLSYVSILCKSQ